MTDFRLLGPFEVRASGELLALPGKPRALLARLLLDTDRVVAAETLIESLWGDDVPRSARKVLQGYVSQLRKALGEHRIETRAPGYVLRASREESDLGRFEALTEAAREAGSATERAELLRRALSLWRGPALAEFRDEPFARAAARRLDELRLNALEERIEADLELGDHARVVGVLETLVEQEPLRERPRRLLMVALYRVGRQADALESYREARRALVEELGIEPSPALQELERAILRHDSKLDLPTPRASRASVVCAGPQLRELVAPLCREGPELVLVDLVTEPAELRERSAALEELRRALIDDGVETRTACFTSDDAGADLVRLATELDAELLVAAGAPELAEASFPCDVAIVPRADLRFEPNAPVLVLFGGERDEWAALELGARLARAHGLPLRLLGSEATGGRRDASRLLASASLALQRFTGTAAEPVLVEPGADGILAERGSVVVGSLPAGELGVTRRTLLERSSVPVLLVRAGLRPGGLAPERTLTRFSWSLRDA